MSASYNKFSFIIIVMFTIIMVNSNHAIAKPNCRGGNKCSYSTNITPKTNIIEGNQIIIINSNEQKTINYKNLCPKCKWKIGPRCIEESPTIAGTEENACRDPKLNRECIAQGEQGIIWDIYTAKPGDNFQLIDSYCFDGETNPISDVDIRQELLRLVDQLAPNQARVTIQPPGGITLVNLPTIFKANKQVPITKKFFPFGIPFIVSARPSNWTWEIDQGKTKFTTNFPGMEYNSTLDPKINPKKYATYTFKKIGKHSVRVIVNWTINANNKIFNTIPINDQLYISSNTVQFTVIEAQAELISPYT